MKTINTRNFNKIAGIDDMKDVKGRTFQFRQDGPTDEDFERKINDEMSGQADIEKSQRLDDIWLDALRKQKAKEREPVFAFTITSKKKDKWIPEDLEEGSFTDYCGGKVTDECVHRGKNSPNKKTKQRAELAETFREMSHKKKNK